MAWRRDQRFFAGMAAAAALTVFVGFAPTYYLRTRFEAPPLLHLHGLLQTCWILLFLTQVALVATSRTGLHRRLGAASAVLPLLMVVVGMLAALDSARRRFAPPGGPPPLVFLVIPVADLVVFSALVAAGLSLRRRSEAHKRLMLLATIGLLPPAIARLPYVDAAAPPAFFGLTNLFVLACLLYDRMAHGRVHPAFLCGGLFLIGSQPVRLLIGGTRTWLDLAAWLTR